MNDSKHWTVPKWPFLLGDALLLTAAYFFIQLAPRPVDRWEIVTAAACVALGAVLGAMPFILDYRAIVKVIEAGALGSIGEKIQNLEKLAAQISAATAEWTNAQVLRHSGTPRRRAQRRGAGEQRPGHDLLRRLQERAAGPRYVASAANCPGLDPPVDAAIECGPRRGSFRQSRRLMNEKLDITLNINGQDYPGARRASPHAGRRHP